MPDSEAPPNPERRRTRSSDTLTALDLQLRAVKETCEVEALVVTDLDGTPVVSVGETDEVIDLAAFAATVLREAPVGRDLTTSRGFVHVDLVQVGTRQLGVAAFAKLGIPSPEGVSRAVKGATRILQEGLARRASEPPPSGGA